MNLNLLLTVLAAEHESHQPSFAPCCDRGARCMCLPPAFVRFAEVTFRAN